MIVAVDFDGTLVEHKYPDIGLDVPGAFEWLKRFRDADIDLILWTMRSGIYLDYAINHCRERDIEFFGVNKNPQQHTWTNSAKAYAHIYIDDAAAGTPLRESRCMGLRPSVDWSKVGPIVMAKLELQKKEQEHGHRR